MNLELVCQIFIPLLSALVAYNVTSVEPKRRRLGYFLGTISQPMWYYTTIHHHQWGLFILSLWYTIQWIKGIKSHWKI